LKAPGVSAWNQNVMTLVLSVAFKFNLRRYNLARAREELEKAQAKLRRAVEDLDDMTRRKVGPPIIPLGFNAP